MISQIDKATNVTIKSITKSTIKKRSFRKRLVVSFMAIILAFNSVCKPVDTKAAAVAAEALAPKVIVAVVGACSGVLLGKSWDTLYDLWKRKHPTDSEDDMQKYFQENITINGNGNYVLTDDALAEIKGLKSEAKNEINMVYGWTQTAQVIDPTQYSQKKQYDGLVGMMEKNSSWLFSSYAWNRGGWYLAYDSNNLGGMVCSTLDGYLQGGLYDSDWEPLYAYEVSVTSEGLPCLMYSLVHCNALKELPFVIDGSITDGIEQFEKQTSFVCSICGKDVDKSQASLLKFRMTDTRVGVTSNLGYDFPTTANPIISYGTQRIECYKTLNDLKRGTAFAKVGGYTPQYANDPKKEVSAKDIDDYDKKMNVYTNGPSSGGGSGGNNSGNNSGDDSGSGSGLGGAIGSLLSSLFGGIAEILKGAIEGIAKLFEQLLEAIKDIQQYLTADVADFFKDLLSFMPEAWVARITLGFSLVMLAFVIRILKG